MSNVSTLSKLFLRLTEEEREHVTLRSSYAIEAFLKEVMQKQVPIMVQYQGKHHFVSQILGCTSRQCTLDAPSPLVLPPLQPSDILLNTSVIEHVPFQFAVPAFNKHTWQGFPALSFPLPSGILRLQRRGAFRLTIPISMNIQATCFLGNEKRKVRVADISMGGIKLSDLSHTWIAQIRRDEVISPRCSTRWIRYNTTNDCNQCSNC